MFKQKLTPSTISPGISETLNIPSQPSAPLSQAPKKDAELAAGIRKIQLYLAAGNEVRARRIGEQAGISEEKFTEIMKKILLTPSVMISEPRNGTSEEEYKKPDGSVESKAKTIELNSRLDTVLKDDSKDDKAMREEMAQIENDLRRPAARNIFNLQKARNSSAISPARTVFGKDNVKLDRELNDKFEKAYKKVFKESSKDIGKIKDSLGHLDWTNQESINEFIKNNKNREIGSFIAIYLSCICAVAVEERATIEWVERQKNNIQSASTCGGINAKTAKDFINNINLLLKAYGAGDSCPEFYVPSGVYDLHLESPTKDLDPYTQLRLAMNCEVDKQFWSNFINQNAKLLAENKMHIDYLTDDVSVTVPKNGLKLNKNEEKIFQNYLAERKNEITETDEGYTFKIPMPLGIVITGSKELSMDKDSISQNSKLTNSRMKGDKDEPQMIK